MKHSVRIQTSSGTIEVSSKTVRGCRELIQLAKTQAESTKEPPAGIESPVDEKQAFGFAAFRSPKDESGVFAENPAETWEYYRRQAPYAKGAPA